MRTLLVALVAVLSLSMPVAAQTPACTNATGTTISGTVVAPNGNDPLPNVLVFVPVTTPAAFTPGVSCQLPGAAPSGAGSIGAITAVDGSFTILNVPEGTNQVVIQTGRWRRQFLISTVNSCVDNPQGKLAMPKNQSQGDIPKFAIATGGADQVECVLRKIGIDDSEFTNPSGTGRINLYQGT